MSDLLRAASGLIDDVIVATCTAPGRGAVGIVRLSGAPAPMDGLLDSLLGAPAARLKPRRLRLAAILDDAGEPLDRGLVVRFPGPGSYTGEDVVELHLHGNPALLAAVVERCVELGARPAGPGEFTRRAVMHGRMDLMAAEAVDGVIRAESLAAVRAVGKHLDGALQTRLAAQRDVLTTVAAALEASVDFPEEIDIDELKPDLDRLIEARDGLLELHRSFVAGRRLVEGARVVLTGPVNAGKSTLFNALLGHERAIVSHHPGTTRDVVSETVVWDRLGIRLEDTAGVRHAVDPVERVGIERTAAARDRADLVVEVRDGRGLRPEVEGATLAVATRADVMDDGQVAEWSDAGWMVVDPTRVEAVRVAIVARLAGDATDGLFLHTIRQADAVGRAVEHLASAVALGPAEPVLCALAVRDAGRALEELVGAWTDEAVLDRLFARFCIGK